MSSLEPIFVKISEETKKHREMNIRKNSTYEEMKVYIEQNSLVKLLTQTNHMFNNSDFDNFLCSLDINSLKVEEFYEPLGCQALLLTCFLCLPNISMKMIEILKNDVSINAFALFTKENYTPISIALLTIEVNPKMEDVVLKMLDYPEFCSLEKVHNINQNTKTYIWQWACKNGYKKIVEKLYNECLLLFNLDDSTDLSESTPLCDLIYWDIGNIANEMIKNHRDKCMLDKVIQGRTALLYALLKGNKLVTTQILCNYDDCSYHYRDPNGLTAFELLIMYGYHGIVTDILENRRDLYMTNFSNDKAKTPFELALYYKNWDIAAILVSYKYIDYEELINSKVVNIPYKQFLILQNEIELLKFFTHIEKKMEPKPPINDSDPAWQKIKELGLETLVKDILKDPMAFAKNSKNGTITINSGDLTNKSDLFANFSKSMTDLNNKISGITQPESKKIERKVVKKQEPINEPIKLEIEKPKESKTTSKKIVETKATTNIKPKKRGRPRKVKPEE